MNEQGGFGAVSESIKRLARRRLVRVVGERGLARAGSVAWEEVASGPGQVTECRLSGVEGQEKQVA